MFVLVVCGKTVRRGRTLGVVARDCATVRQSVGPSAATLPFGSSHSFYRNVVLRKTSSYPIQFAARSASGLFGTHITGILVLALNSMAIPHCGSTTWVPPF